MGEVKSIKIHSQEFGSPVNHITWYFCNIEWWSYLSITLLHEGLVSWVFIILGGCPEYFKTLLGTMGLVSK